MGRGIPGPAIISLLLILFVTAALSVPPPTVAVRQENGTSSTESEAKNGFESTKTGPGPLLTQQLSNPKEILAVLLIIGGEVIQKAIIQLTKHIPVIPSRKIEITKWKITTHRLQKPSFKFETKEEEEKWVVTTPALGFTPVAFSFGWVAYAFAATATVWGEGTLAPPPEGDLYVVDIVSGTCKKNESWILYRLIRDLEQSKQCRLKENHKTVHIYYTKGRAGHPKRDWVLLLVFPVALAGQFILGFAAMWHLGDWRVLMITGAGTVLAALTGSLPQWAAEKYDARDTSSNYIVTRGNGHPHSFAFYHRTGEPDSSSMNLEDLAVVRPENMASWSTKILMPFLALLWTFVLISVGGLEQGTWYLFGVGAVGMFANYLVSVVHRTPEAHGFPLEKLNGEGVVTSSDKQMHVLRDAEIKHPGLGLGLLDMYFPRLKPEELTEWRGQEGFEGTTEKRRNALKRAPPRTAASHTASTDEASALPVDVPPQDTRYTTAKSTCHDLVVIDPASEPASQSSGRGVHNPLEESATNQEGPEKRGPGSGSQGNGTKDPRPEKRSPGPRV